MAKTTPEKIETVETELSPAPAEPTRRRGACVVNDGRCIGSAAIGVVCSYHAVYYRSDGTRRD